MNNLREYAVDCVESLSDTEVIAFATIDTASVARFGKPWSCVVRDYRQKKMTRKDLVECRLRLYEFLAHTQARPSNII